MSKHGYTVDHGWFNGVCSGQRFAPLQTERAQADKIVAQVRADCFDLDTLAAQYKTGKKFPRIAGTRYNHLTQTNVDVLWDDAADHMKESGLHHAIWATEQRAKMGRSFAADLEALANSVHGTELIVVPLEDGPARIEAGEKRQSSAAVLVATGQDKGRVYWKSVRESGKPFSGWTGSTAWRKLPMA